MSLAVRFWHMCSTTNLSVCLGFAIERIMSNETRYFTSEHHWLEAIATANNSIMSNEAAQSPQLTYRLGLTAFVIDQLGEITFIELPTIGTTLKAGDVLGSIESIKTISELYAPVDCVIQNRNTQLLSDPTLINTNAETDAWCVDITLSSPDQLNTLLDASAYLKGQTQSDSNMN